MGNSSLLQQVNHFKNWFVIPESMWSVDVGDYTRTTVTLLDFIRHAVDFLISSFIPPGHKIMTKCKFNLQGFLLFFFFFPFCSCLVYRMFNQCIC